MADKQQDRGSFPRAKYKDLGDGSYAEVIALESGSIGGGGADPTYLEDTAAVDGEKVIMAGVVRKDAAGTLVSTDGDRTELQVDANGYLRVVSAGGGSGVSIADGADVAQGTTTDASSASTVIGLLKNIKGELAGSIAVTGTFWQATQPVSGTFWQATQPVSLATNTPDVTDRAARLLGHVTVDNASIAVTGTFWQATQPVSGTVTANAGTGTFGTNVAQVAGTATDVNSGVKSAGTQRVVLATDQPQLTNALKVDGSAVTQPVSGTVTANAGTGTLATSLASLPALATGSNLIGRVNVEPQTNNGLSISRTLSAASTNGTNIKGSAGQIYTIVAHNTNAAVRYLKVYNKATAPTVGTDTPVLTFPIPGNAAGAGFVIDTTMGISFATGIGIGLTTGVADADTGAVAANEIVVNVLYK